MCHFDVPAGLWPEAVKTLCYVRNRLPLDGNPDGKSPLQLWTSSAEPEDLSHLRTFGCYVVFTLTDQERVRGEKFHAIGIEGAFLGYEENRVGYRVWHPEKRIVLFRINVYFDETKKGIFKKSESNEQAQSEEETLSFGPILEAEGQPTLAPEHADPLLSDHPDPVEDLPMEDPVLQQGVPELESPAEKHTEAIPTRSTLRRSSRPVAKLKFDEAFPIAHVTFDTKPFLSHAEYQEGSLENLILPSLLHELQHRPTFRRR